MENYTFLVLNCMHWQHFALQMLYSLKQLMLHMCALVTIKVHFLLNILIHRSLTKKGL